MKIKLFNITAILLFFCGLSFQPLKAQAISFPCFNGFETTLDEAGWVFVEASGIPNKWVIDTATYAIGNRSLYISADNGQTAGYVNMACGVAAYKELLLPAGSQYEISFDWKAAGEGSADMLYVCLVTDFNELPASSNVDGSLPTGLTTFVKQTLNTSPVWKNASFTVNGRNGSSWLLFYWVNNSSNSQLPGACIDNIQIGKRGTNCLRPDSLKAEYANFNDVIITWAGNAGTYELSYGRPGTDKLWTAISGINANSYTLSGLSKGVYSFWLRSICGNDTSTWSVYSNFVMPVSSENCINFINFHSPDITAAYGTVDNPASTPGVVDYGYLSVDSRHTVHYDTNETDSRTGNKLKTVPPGEIASVRLGNWNGNNMRAESLIYDYYIDSTANILLLKYAVVVENPSSHSYEEKPRFMIEILDSNGSLVDAECGMVDFVAGFTTDNWNSEMGDITEVLWKDWSTIGLNVQRYAGQTIKIRLTTRACGLGLHFGYAYFTLDCASASLSGLTCGDHTVEAVEAPDGFLYEWSKITKPDSIITTDRVLRPVQNDTATYVCKIISPENADCSFELIASLLPQYPKAEVSYTVKREDCQNKVLFMDKSYVYTEPQEGIRQISENKTIETYFWDFGNGETFTGKTPPAILYDPPLNSPDTMYYVSLKVGVNNQLCEDVWSDSIVIYPIGPATEYIEANICEGEYYTLMNGRIVNQPDTYKVFFRSSSGCMDTVVVNLTVLKTYKKEITDTICYEETYDKNGFEGINTSGFYKLNLKTAYGCDSIVTLHLTVLEELNAELSPAPFICADEINFSVPYNIISNESITAHVVFDEKAKSGGFTDFSFSEVPSGNITIPIPHQVVPGTYTANIVFYRGNCSSASYPVLFTIQYPDSIITQRWNDILSVRNSIYNGGYEFSSYQWYKDGVEIPGATKSYLYVPEGLDFNVAYAVNLIQQGQTEAIMSCEFIPGYITGPITIYPTAVKRNMQQTVEVPVGGTISVYDIMGLKYSKTNLYEGRNQLTAPNVTGIYLYQIRLNNGQERTYRISVSE